MTQALEENALTMQNTVTTTMTNTDIGEENRILSVLQVQ